MFMYENFIKAAGKEKNGDETMNVICTNYFLFSRFSDVHIKYCK